MMKEDSLIFIISQPRSGSTYIQNLLSNNSEVNTCSEPWVLLNFANQIKPSLVSTQFNNKLAVQAFQDYLSKYQEIEFRSEFKQFILNLYNPMAKGYTYVIDKTPRYWELMDEIVTLFPKSKIIVIKRDPLAVLKSIIKTWDLKTVFDLYEFRNDILNAPKRILEFCNAQQQNPNVYVLKYEDVLDHPKTEIRKLYEWVGLNYVDSVLDTEINNKYKGRFGDPFQNAHTETDVMRKEANNKEINKELNEFINGYTHFLNPAFLKEYGNYNADVENETAAFNDFLVLSGDVLVLNKKLQYLKNSTSYKLGRTIVMPFAFIKKIFK